LIRQKKTGRKRKADPNFIFCPQVHIVLELIPPPPVQNSGDALGEVRRGRSPAKADASVACGRCVSKISTPSHCVRTLRQ